MIAPPCFSSLGDYVASMGQVDFWRPYVTEALARHDLIQDDRVPSAGFNATYPTFVCGDVVVKFFGHWTAWQAAFDAETSALTLVNSNSKILAPRLLGAGTLFEAPEDPWPYLIMSRVPGAASWRFDRSPGERMDLARTVGHQVREIHALPRESIATDDTWSGVDIVAAVEQSSLPVHLLAQVEDYLKALGPPDLVVTHGDMVANHVFLEDGRYTGIIDWGDAMVTDRHVELIQLYRDLFRCNGAEFRAFLDAYEWPRDGEFAYRALAHALRRQAFGFVQHHSIDVFQPIAEAFPLDEIKTLEELAQRLFAV